MLDDQHCNDKLLREISSPFVIWIGLDYFFIFFLEDFLSLCYFLKSGTKQRENFSLFCVWFKCFRNSKQKEMKMKIKEGFLFLGNAEKTKEILSWFLALCLAGFFFLDFSHPLDLISTLVFIGTHKKP